MTIAEALIWVSAIGCGTVSITVIAVTFVLIQYRDKNEDDE